MKEERNSMLNLIFMIALIVGLVRLEYERPLTAEVAVINSPYTTNIVAVGLTNIPTMKERTPT
jgi:hypothetical protein